jgi:predicted nucleotidyltransferase
MVIIPEKVQKIINDYLFSLEKNGINIKQAFLFGSYAKGNATNLSDIDIALVSDEFVGVRFLDKNKIRKITISVSSDLEVLPFNSNLFNNNDPLVTEILSTGVRLV